MLDFDVTAFIPDPPRRSSIVNADPAFFSECTGCGRVGDDVLTVNDSATGEEEEYCTECRINKAEHIYF